MNEETPTGPTPTHVRWLIVAGLVGLAVLGHFNRVSISVAGTERFMRDKILDQQQMGQIYSAFLFVYTLCMLPAGWIIDRFGPIRALTGMGLGMGSCVIATGLVGAVAGVTAFGATGFWLSLMVVRGLAGALSSPLHPAAARTVSLSILPDWQIRANGLVTAGALLGVAASYPLFGWLMDQLGWRAAFIASGSVMVVAALTWGWLLAGRVTLRSDTNTEQRAIAKAIHFSGQGRRAITVAQMMRLCTHRGLILLSLSYAAVGYFQYLFMYWIQYYLEEILGRSKTESRNGSALINLAMAVGMAGGGWCADWLCRRWGTRWGRRAIALGGMLSSGLLAASALFATEPNQAIAGFALAFAAMGICEGVFWTSVTDIGGRHGGIAAAILNTVGNAAGALAPWLTAVLQDRWGWPVAIGVACGLAGLGGLLWLAFDPQKRVDEPGSSC